LAKKSLVVLSVAMPEGTMQPTRPVAEMMSRFVSAKME